MKNVLFDLDGTLSDPCQGMYRSFNYAFERIGRSSLPTEALRQLIGPPLRENFASVLGAGDDKLIAEAISHFRYSYDVMGGIFENIVYPGISQLLEALFKNDVRLFVATSKVEAAAKRIIKHFGLDHYFVSIHGSGPDGSTSKSVVISTLLNERGLDNTECMMVGDRHHDIIGAIKNGVKPVGVLWGYGSEAELLQAGAEAVVNQPSQILNLVGSSIRNVVGPNAAPAASPNA